MKQIDGQLDLFSVDFTPRVKPCECGYTKLAVHITGCGIPTGGYLHYPLTFDKYIYHIFCPKCLTVAGDRMGWSSFALNMNEALKDWNNYPHKKSYEWQINSLKKSANKMVETINNFPSITDVLGINHTYTGGQ